MLTVVSFLSDLDRKGSDMRGAIVNPSAYAKCIPCMYGLAFSCHISNSHAFPATSTPEVVIPRRTCVKMKIIRLEEYGTAVPINPLLARHKTIPCSLSIFVKSQPKTRANIA